jgi:type 1 fimbria pilin
MTRGAKTLAFRSPRLVNADVLIGTELESIEDSPGDDIYDCDIDQMYTGLTVDFYNSAKVGFTVDKKSYTLYKTSLSGIGLRVQFKNICNGNVDENWSDATEHWVCAKGLLKQGARVRVALVKYAPVVPGVIKIQLAASFQAIYGNKGDLPYRGAYNYSIPNIVIERPCNAYADSKDLGSYGADLLKGDKATTPPVDVSIHLIGCAPGLNTYQLDPNTTYTGSVMDLDAKSTAKGVGIQLLDKDKNAIIFGTPLEIDSKMITSDTDNKIDKIDIPLSARYYHKIGEDVGAGTANGSITFTVTHR